jgi:hypothetical protein
MSKDPINRPMVDVRSRNSTFISTHTVLELSIPSSTSHPSISKKESLKNIESFFNILKYVSHSSIFQDMKPQSITNSITRFNSNTFICRLLALEDILHISRFDIAIEWLCFTANLDWSKMFISAENEEKLYAVLITRNLKYLIHIVEGRKARNFRIHGVPLMCIAVMKNSVDMVKMLCSIGADVNVSPNVTEYRSHYEYKNDTEHLVFREFENLGEWVHKLTRSSKFSKRCDFNIKWTPLSLVALYNNIEIYLTLVDAGADTISTPQYLQGHGVFLYYLNDLTIYNLMNSHFNYIVKQYEVSENVYVNSLAEASLYYTSTHIQDMNVCKIIAEYVDEFNIVTKGNDIYTSTDTYYIVESVYISVHNMALKLCDSN